MLIAFSVGDQVLESPFFFGETPRLFGMLHVPASGPGQTAFVFSHPFAEEKLWSHRVYVSLARALAASGHTVLRFDYMGAGDSPGFTTDTSLATHLTNLMVAVETLRDRYPQLQSIGLAGLRLGATFAALFVESVASDERYKPVWGAPLLLWDPILDGQTYLRDMLRSNLSTQLAVFGKVLENREVLEEKIRNGASVNVDGYELSKDFFVSCAQENLLSAAPKRHAGPTLVMQIAPNDNVPMRDDLQKLAQSYERGAYLRATEQPFWREIKPFYARANNLQQSTLQWLEHTRV